MSGHYNGGDRGRTWLHFGWFGLNCAMSHHMLKEPTKNYVRLTCLAQHAVTIFSAVLCFGVMEEEDWWHAHLTLMMTKVSILFTGLLGVFVMYKNNNKDNSKATRISTPVTKKKMTVWRILRNVYCHYGTCGILWYLGPDLKQIHPLHNSIVLSLWLALTHPWLTKIYDVEQLRTSQLVLPLAALAFLSDGVLMTLCLRLQRDS
mmetsp:Transcript_16663/g.30310  ORF Transcript_16663/g.30310 Transcript_16663/m.30310 type:complete len:204 (+) Transcript_16663:102-713(+)